MQELAAMLLSRQDKELSQNQKYVLGTLFGEWLDGTAFEGIRFIDRFQLSEGLIVRQDVWNDMGEVRK